MLLCTCVHCALRFPTPNHVVMYSRVPSSQSINHFRGPGLGAGGPLKIRQKVFFCTPLGARIAFIHGQGWVPSFVPYLVHQDLYLYLCVCVCILPFYISTMHYNTSPTFRCTLYIYIVLLEYMYCTLHTY